MMKKIFAAMILLLGCSLPALGQAYTYNSNSSCQGSAAAQTANCSTTVSDALGDLLVVVTYAQAPNLPGVTAAAQFTGPALCSGGLTQVGSTVLQSNGTGTFVEAMFACVVDSPNTTTIQTTWTGTADTNPFTALGVADYSSSTGFLASPLDGTPGVNIATTATSSCPTGSTTTTNNTDLLVATCTNFNAGQTWGTDTGYSNEVNSSRNTLGWYDSLAVSPGAQSTTIPLATADYGLGMIAAFKINPGARSHVVQGSVFVGGSVVQR